MAEKSEILNDIDNNDIIALWEKVKYVGYKEVPSVHKRKLIFAKAFHNFDKNRNDNFITFYYTYIKNSSVYEYNRSKYLVLCTKKELNSMYKKEFWEEDSDEVINQKENIMSSFCF